jgi:CzcA family heavy metal efflux pump
VGRYAASGQQILALASGLWTSADQIADAVVRSGPGATVRVRDVGRVFPGAPDRTLLVTSGGQDAVSVGITQQIGANILSVQRDLDATLARLATTLPSGLTLTRVYDLAEFVRSAIANVRDAILVGGLLAVLVLLVFLRDLRLTVIAAVTLPLAVVPTFAVMKLFGGSINLMSMGGLAVAIGLVIDDAVVVVENLHRRASEGASSVAAAVDELLGPLTSSTLTTVVVFAPLGLLSGVPGQFFRALSLSLSAAVLLSLVWSVTVVPILARWAFRHGSHAPEHPRETRLERGYGRILAAVLRRPALAVAAAIVLAVTTVVAFLSVGTGFLPPADEGGFVIDYLTPAGTSLDETDRQVRAMEGVVASVPEVASYMRRTGSELGLFATPPNSGDIVVRLKPRAERDRSADEVIADLRSRLSEAAPAAEIEFVLLLQDMLGDLEGNSTPIEVKIFGDDSDVLARLSEPVTELLDRIPGVVDVVGMQKGNPEVSWEIDPVAAGRYGLTTEEAGAQLSSAWLGRVATDLRLLDRRIPVRVRLPDAVRFDPPTLSSTLLRAGSGSLVPLSTVAHAVRSNGQAQLFRENLRQMAMVTARLEERDLGSAVAEIRSGLASLPLPVGYTYELGGQYDSQRQAFRELLLVFATAVTLVFMILVVQFEEIGSALLVLLAAPLSAVGALALLMLAGVDLDVSSAMGLILLIGLVVKNGIMLIDYTRRLRRDGEAWADALSHAGRVRLRPILMTTFCTLFGLLPLALGIGAGAELQRPLALAVIGGLALSTPITLIVLPGLYAALHRRPA